MLSTNEEPQSINVFATLRHLGPYVYIRDLLADEASNHTSQIYIKANQTVILHCVLVITM